MMKVIISLLLSLYMPMAVMAVGVGGGGMYQWSVELRGYISSETGKAPTAYLWIPQGCKHVKAVMVAQQNMTEEALFKNESFKQAMSRLDVALLWVAPAFSNNWDPHTACQTIFDEMLVGVAHQSGHMEIAQAPIIPMGHSAQATFPWNFAAWNPHRTLCVISLHGDAPRTNLTGYGTANVEWGRTRNIDGIPGLLIIGEYEWWEARVTPALAFRMMYPGSCISMLADTGRGHFDCGEATANYIALFIAKAIEHRLASDGTLTPVDPRQGWLADRYRCDMPQTDGADRGKPSPIEPSSAQPAPYALYKGDRHDAFWYFDKEMALMAQQRHDQSRGKQMQYVGFEYGGQLVPLNPNVQGGMQIRFDARSTSDTLRIRAVFTDSTHTATTQHHAKSQPRIEVICGPLRQVGDDAFVIYQHEAGWDNPRRSRSAWLVAVGDGDSHYRGCVQPLCVSLPQHLP